MSQVWDKRQIHDFVKRAKEPIGDGWNWVGTRTQEAIIKAAALGVVRAQACETITIAAVDELTERMLAAAGL